MTPAPKQFNTWLELFDYLKTNGFADDQRVALIYPQETPKILEPTDTIPEVQAADNEVVLYVDEIKARAFDELYERLPLIATIETLADLVDGITKMKPVAEFLNKLPTRVN